MNQEFTVQFTFGKTKGTFSDPFYPWITYQYRSVDNKDPSKNHNFMILMENNHTPNGEVSGVINLIIGKSDKFMVYDLTTNERCVIYHSKKYRDTGDTISITIKHIKPPNVYNLK